MKWTILIACCVLLGWPASAAAHRLDEYLQATRIALAQDGVDVEIDLTPGVSVAAQVVGLIDIDRDGALSIAEQRAYATRVVQLAALSIDGAPAPLVLAASDYPSVAEMRAGTGTIRLKARSTVRAASPGAHVLAYVNVHQSEMSAYLVNALAPPSAIHITRQQRDPWQRQLTLEYVVDRPGGITARFASGLGVGFVMVCALGWFRRSSIRSVASRYRAGPQTRGANAKLQK